MAAAAETAERTYVDFVPPHNLVEEPDRQSLILDLSAAGFKKEHLRVQIDNYGRVRISGERPLEGSKWSRFRKEIHVPEGCNAGDIRARFDKDGLLHITMPRLSPVAEEPKAAAGAKTGDHNAGQDQKPAGHSNATAEDGENKRQEEEDARRPPDQEEEHKSEEEGGRSEGDGGRGEAVAATTTRPAYELAGNRRMVWALLLAVVLALVGVGFYRLMDPSAEPAAPADDHFVGLSDY